MKKRSASVSLTIISSALSSQQANDLKTKIEAYSSQYEDKISYEPAIASIVSRARPRQRYITVRTNSAP